MNKIRYFLAVGAIFLIASCGSSAHSGNSTDNQSTVKNEKIGSAEGYQIHRITLENGQQCVVFDSDSDWNLGLSCDWTPSTTTTSTTIYIP